MAINIKDPEADRMVRALAAKRGQPITDMIKDAVRALEAEEARAAQERYDRRMEAGRKLAAAMDAAPILDPRPWREIRDEAWGDDDL